MCCNRIVLYDCSPHQNVCSVVAVKQIEEREARRKE